MLDFREGPASHVAVQTPAAWLLSVGWAQYEGVNFSDRLLLTASLSPSLPPSLKINK